MKNLFNFKWLLLSIVLSIASINTAWAYERTFDGTERVFFKNIKPSGWGDCWICASRTGWVHFWRSGYANTSDVKLTLVSGTEGAEGAIYVCTPAAGTYTDVTIVRSSTSATMTWSEKSKDISVGSDGSLNYINNLSPSDWGENFGHWAKYAPTPAVVGSMNGWKAEANPATSTRFTESSQKVQIIPVTLAASTTYTFRVITGENLYGKTSLTITGATKDGSWESYSTGDGKDVTLTTDEAGEYIFQFNESSKYVAVYYPKGRFTKNKVVYFDASGASSSYWNQATFDSKFYFKYYDSGTNVDGGSFCNATNKLEGNVYYATVPNDDWAGQIVIDRYNPNDHNEETGKWNTSGVAYATGRSSSTENCFGITVDGWSPSLGGWTTYCPPISSATLSDNSTTKISWQTGSGTEGDPYLVPASGTIKVSASATSMVEADDNMTKKYDFKVNTGSGASSEQDGTATTFNKSSLSNNTTYEISVEPYNYYNSTSGTKYTSATHKWYKALTMYSVTHDMTNVTKSAGRDGDNAAAYHLAYSATYSASTGYNLPETITVKFGSTTKTAGTDYTWNQGTGVLSIPVDKIDGNVTVIIDGEEKTYAVSYAAGTYGSGSLAGGTKYHFTNYTLSDNSTAFTRDNYVYDGWSTNTDGSTKDYNLGGTYSTNAAQTFYPHWVSAYSVTHTLEHASTASGATGAKAAVNGVAYVATFTADAGYALPSDITVTVGGATKTKGTHYTWSISDGVGTLTVFAASVTGNIVVAITGEPATLRFAGTGTQWNNTGSWTPACIPTINHDVVIATNTCWIGENVQAKAKSVRIDSYNGGANIRIEAGGGLIIAEDIKAKHSADGSYEATNDQDLWIKTSTLYNGGLVCGNECPGTNAEYVFQSRIYRYGSFYINQYVGIPFTGMDPFQWYGVYVFEYDPEKDNWKTPEDQYADLKPFTAYDIISKTSGVTYTDFYTHGELNLPGTSGTQKLTCGSRIDDTFGEDGDYMFANSWIAPIDVASIDDTEAASKDGEGDYWGILGEVHYFNAGYVNPSEDAKKEIGDLAGQWSVLPFSSSSYMENAVIPACQAFCVTATSAGGWLKLNYGKHVYTPAANAGQINKTPTHAPRRVKAEDVAPIKLRVKVSSGSDIADQIYIFEREDFTEGYDNSWDGAKLFGNATAPQLYTEKGDFKLSVDATPEMDGTLIGFKAGTNDYEYTFSFEYDDDEPLYLYDKETQDFTRISNEATYTFQTKDNAEHSRFALTRSNAPQIVTAFENTEYEAENRAEKFIKNNMLFIRRGDKVYSIDGTQVK